MTPTADELRAAYALPDRATPRVRMNFVESADGAATLDGRSGALGGETDRTLMRILRAMCDVVLVGAGTVRAEGYGGVGVDGEDAARRRSAGLSGQPRLAVVSGSLALEPRHPFFADAVTRPLVVTCAASPAQRRAALDDVADVLVCGGDAVDLPEAIARLAERGMTQVLCEGGPHLFGALLEAGLVAEVCVTIAPRIVGGDAPRISRGAPEADRRFALSSALTDDDGFVFLRYAAK